MSIPGYRALKRLGEGAFGEVYLCEVEGTSQKVAVKILRLPDDGNLRRFYREVEILHREISNPYVVNLLNFNLDAAPPYLVMEYCEGGSLRSWVGSRRPWQQVVRVLAHAAMGLCGIHQKGGFHRDIKPDNILLAASPSGLVAKVGDFGVARIPYTDSTLMTRSAMGTPPYMAPEVLYRSPYTAAADVYSLGITGIELLTGNRQWSALNGFEVPAELYGLLVSMIDDDPRGRPSIEEIKRVLQSLAQTTAVRIQPPARPAPVAIQSRANVNGSIGAGLLLGGAALGLWLMARRGNNSTRWDSSVERYRGSDGRFRSG